MLTRIRSKLTYANVMATAAMFVAVSGGAVYAATELGRNDVTAKNLAPKSVGSSELKKDAAKGGDVDEATLSRVPSATEANSADRAGSASEASTSDLLDGFDANSLVRTAAGSTANAPETGTAATATIQAPVPGFLTIFATADFVYGSAADQVECFLEVDETTVPNTSRVSNINGSSGAEADSDCATNATRSVAAGSHKVDLEIAQVDDGTVAAAGVSVIFTPFDANGAVG